MSRISNCIKNIPSNIALSFNDSFLQVSSNVNVVSIYIDESISLDLTNGIEINVKPGITSRTKIKRAMAISSTLSRIISNTIQDVVKGYVVNINMIGVGFKSSVNNNFLHLSLGFSHDIVYKIDNGLKVSISDNINIQISGFDRQKVMQFANQIRKLKQPEPYKGKGLFLNGEKIIKKEVKKK